MSIYVFPPLFVLGEFSSLIPSISSSLPPSLKRNTNFLMPAKLSLLMSRRGRNKQETLWEVKYRV
ncbi:hypothetical protein I7I52_01730 [Histoplasma capsulatum]|uniref:Uncharacterized protein n=1 Tax=Ajellomyces capsulatus TaxID=5037 RepID=A0A8H7Z7N8_AJECA|nr:hypothetical protein I7I52_01730 [Histoplasma capsulatum]